MYLSGISSSVFFFFFFFPSFCITAVLQCWSLFAALIVFRHRAGWHHVPQARASTLARVPCLQLQLPAPVGATPSLLQQDNGLLGPGIGALRSQLSSEDTEGGYGLRSHRQVIVDMGGRDSVGFLCPECSLSPTLHQNIAVGKSLDFPVVRITIHQVRARMSLSLKGWDFRYL